MLFEVQFLPKMKWKLLIIYPIQLRLYSRCSELSVQIWSSCQLISFFGVITHFKDGPKWAYSRAGPSQWAVISNGQSDLPHNLSARRHKHIIQICKTTTEVNLIRCAFKKMYICYAIMEIFENGPDYELDLFLSTEGALGILMTYDNQVKKKT